MPAEVDVIIIGAGVVGLAIAAEVSQFNKNVFVFEKNRTFGLETSSQTAKLSTRVCIILKIRSKQNSALAAIPALRILREIQYQHKKLGKLIVAADDVETKQVERLYRQGLKNGVTGLQILTRDEIKKLEPNVQAVAALLSPSTGVVDSYNLLRCFYGRAKENGAEFIFNTEVIGIERKNGSYRVDIRDDEGISSVTTKVVINAAGLFSDRIAQSAGIDLAKAGYQLHYCKGQYFCLDPKLGRLVDRLVYPVPEQSGVGIHITLSVDGRSGWGRTQNMWIKSNTLSMKMISLIFTGRLTAICRQLNRTTCRPISPGFVRNCRAREKGSVTMLSGMRLIRSCLD